MRVLKPASANVKLGSGANVITRGPFRGMRLFTLTLQERATCDKACPQRAHCYGDNMPFALRYNPGADLAAALHADCETLARKYPNGFAVRLHVLGDFYSVAYARAWASLLASFPMLHVYGYTHRRPEDPIGAAVDAVRKAYPKRFSILQSDGPLGASIPSALVTTTGQAIPGTVLCPQQTGKTASCLTCGLCMNGRTSVTFLAH